MIMSVEGQQIHLHTVLSTYILMTKSFYSILNKGIHGVNFMLEKKLYSTSLVRSQRNLTQTNHYCFANMVNPSWSVPTYWITFMCAFHTMDIATTSNGPKATINKL